MFSWTVYYCARCSLPQFITHHGRCEMMIYLSLIYIILHLFCRIVFCHLNDQLPISKGFFYFFSESSTSAPTLCLLLFYLSLLAWVILRALWKARYIILSGSSLSQTFCLLQNKQGMRIHLCYGLSVSIFLVLLNDFSGIDIKFTVL